MAERFFVSDWYELVKKYTIPREKYEMDKKEMETLADCLFYCEENLSDKDIVKKFPRLAKFLKAELEKYKQGIFIRWDNRSPKDYFFYYCKTAEDIHPKPIKTVEECFRVLLNSERLAEDIFAGLFNGVLWASPFVEIKHEMRGFVYENKLFALSQYYYKDYDRLLAEHAMFYAEHYFDLWDKIRLPFSTYVIDFGWNMQAKKPIIIELNPFNKLTDPCLFSWDLLHKLKDQGRFIVRVNQLQIVEYEDGVEREYPQW